jgi:hypothetical protein
VGNARLLSSESSDQAACELLDSPKGIAFLDHYLLRERDESYGEMFRQTANWLGIRE